jgi:hypothetical protein
MLTMKSSVEGLSFLALGGNLYVVINFLYKVKP